LENILIYAPAIRLADKVEATIQLFASDSIIVGEDCKLDFPSTINLISPNISRLSVSKGCVIRGNITQYQENTTESKSTVQIDAGAQIEGVVYSNGYVQCQGKITGSLYADNLFLKNNSGYYENHLNDIEIDFTKLSRRYVSSILLDKRKQRVLSWRY
jgi:hypothetical protein